MALSDLQQRLVWEGWFSGEVRANYFADLAGRYRWRQSLATWLTLILSSGAVLTLVTHLLPHGFEWVPATLAALSACVTGYVLVARNHDKATESTTLQAGWSTLASAYRALWEDMYAADAATRFEALEARGNELSPPGNRLPERRRLIRKWHARVASYHVARTAA